MGRTFNISFRMYDTVSRYVRVNLNHCTSMANSIIDNRRSFYNVVTTAGQWTDVSIDYSVYEPMYGEFGAINKKLTVAIVNKGAEQNPIYFDGVKVVEKVDTPIIGWFYLVSSEEKYKCLPDGMVDIVCHKSPWSR